MKKILALVLCLCLVFSLGAFGAEAFADGETVVVAIGAGFNTLDPGRVYEKYPPLVVNACYENLFKFYSNDGGAEPCLAESYSFSDDGLTLTVTLKDSVFSSGNPVTSTDVKFSIERCRNLQDNPAFITDTIESIDTPDAKTIAIQPWERNMIQKIEKAKNLQVNFSIAKNVTASNGVKTLYVRIQTPAGQVLTAGTFPYENRQLEYSMKKVIEYAGEEISVQTYWQVGEYLEAGQYRVSIFADGNMIGSKTFTFE